MDSSTSNMVYLGIFIMCLTGFGSGLRVVQKPQPFTYLTEKLTISCIADDPSYKATTIFSMQIMRHVEEKPIASIDLRQKLKKPVGIKDNVKAEGRIDTESNKSYLTLNIYNPDKQDAGIYRCQMFYLDNNFQMVEKNVIGNVTFQETHFTAVVSHMARTLSSLLARDRKENNTLQTLTNQHSIFSKFHSESSQDIDILNDKIDIQNNTITEQDRELEELKQNMDILKNKLDIQNNTITQQDKKLAELRDNNTKQKQDIDMLTNEMEIQKNTSMKQSTQINTLITDNAQKQRELDMLIDYIKHQNGTIQKNESEHQKIAKEPEECPDEGWAHYQKDKTCIRAFGVNGTSEDLTWSKARDSCQSFGGDLVQIHDENKNKFVFNLFRGETHAWIGVKNQAEGGYNFQYVNGSDLGSYHPWYGRNPDGSHDSQKCVGIHTESKGAGQWFDWKCNEEYPYACSKVYLK